MPPQKEDWKKNSIVLYLVHILYQFGQPLDETIQVIHLKIIWIIFKFFKEFIYIIKIPII